MSLSTFELLDDVPHPLAIIAAGKYDEVGKRGGMTAAWLSRVSFHPPLMAVAISPYRHTYKLIIEYRAFTINLVSKELENITMEVFGSLSGRDVDKFKACGIEPLSARRVLAPVIPKSPLVIECRYAEDFKIGDHMVVIGEVVDAYRLSDEVPLIYLKGTSARVCW